MMKKIYKGLLSLTLALASCTVEIAESPASAGPTPATDDAVFHGAAETGVGTRCLSKDTAGSIDIFWNDDDEIALFRGSPLCSRYGVTPDAADRTRCTFYFKESGQFAGATPEYDANYALHPYYPGSVACEKIDGIPTMTFSLPATQHYNAEGHAGIGCIPMTAATRSRTETDLPFMVAVGALRLQLYTTETDPVKITGLRFVCNGDERVSGAAAVAMHYLETGQAGEPRLTMTGAAAKEVAVDCGEGVELSTDADHPTQFAIALPPQTFAKGFTIEATDDRGRKMEITKAADSQSPVTIARREFYAMKAIAFEPENEGWVDLALPSGTLWATKNIGAEKTTDFGNYYAWGEIKENTSSSIGDYTGLWVLNNYDFGKYYDHQNSAQYDTAARLLGNGWMMPNQDDWIELIEQCAEIEWCTENGTAGLRVTGTNGKTLFLPAAGYKQAASSYEINLTCYYWSSEFKARYDGAESVAAMWYAEESALANELFDCAYYNRTPCRPIRRK